MKFKVDQDKCLRCGMCTGIATDLFVFDDEGNIEIKNEEKKKKNVGEAKEAMASCPVSAISEDEE